VPRQSEDVEVDAEVVVAEELSMLIGRPEHWPELDCPRLAVVVAVVVVAVAVAVALAIAAAAMDWCIPGRYVVDEEVDLSVGLMGPGIVEYSGIVPRGSCGSSPPAKVDHRRIPADRSRRP
jgi:hypothetical protein